ncbi:hypothetical protein NCC49_005598 [Naganishia albida]|nr:hypothetical protein NCC49_005598 [Naganishia albida]
MSPVSTEIAQKVVIKRWAAQVHAAHAQQAQTRPARIRETLHLRLTPPRVAKPERAVRDPTALPLDQLTKEEMKARWKRVVKAGMWSLLDEYHERSGAHYRNDYELKKRRLGWYGSNEERLWVSAKSKGGAKLSQTNTQASGTSGSSTGTFKHTLKKARRSLKDECHYFFYGTSREDFDKMRRRLGLHGGDEERLWIRYVGGGEGQ